MAKPLGIGRAFYFMPVPIGWLVSPPSWAPFPDKGVPGKAVKQAVEQAIMRIAKDKKTMNEKIKKRAIDEKEEKPFRQATEEPGC
jgi:hypothetical protein